MQSPKVQQSAHVRAMRPAAELAHGKMARRRRTKRTAWQAAQEPQA
jgi:hypothetical protein